MNDSLTPPDLWLGNASIPISYSIPLLILRDKILPEQTDGRTDPSAQLARVKVPDVRIAASTSSFCIRCTAETLMATKGGCHAPIWRRVTKHTSTIPIPTEQVEWDCGVGRYFFIRDTAVEARRRGESSDGERIHKESMADGTTSLPSKTSHS